MPPPPTLSLHGPHRLREIAVIAVWAATIVAGYRVGYDLYSHDPRVHIGDPPLVGAQDVRWSARLWPAIGLGVVTVGWGPVLARRLPWRALLAASWAAGVAWAVALAAGDGWDALSTPLRSRYEYLAAVDRVTTAPGGFLRTFSDLDVLRTYPTHVKGHPPGLLLVLSWFDRIGLGGAGWATVLCLGTGALVAPAALVAMRACASTDLARGAAPFLAVTPAAVWVATSADACFAGVAATGVALVALAVAPPAGGQAAAGTARRHVATAVAGGLVLGVALHLSYGIAPLGLLVGGLITWRRAWVLGVFVGAGVLVVVALFAAGGFFWPDGLDATRVLYHAGVASRRPYGDFLLVNLAAFAIAIGPAALAGLATLRDRRLWVLAGGGVAAVLAADLSGLSRGETERIWLPFVPWVLVGTAALAGSRRWLALQVLLGFVVQLTVRSPW